MTGIPSEAPKSISSAAEALLKLGEGRPELAEKLASLLAVVADEATRTSRFANALTTALSPQHAPAEQPKRTGRRKPGILDPFAIYSDAGEGELRRQLAALDLNQLRDIVAENGMDHDRLAMKWKDPRRVIDRIVDKVSARLAKGSAFRTSAQ